MKNMMTKTFISCGKEFKSALISFLIVGKDLMLLSGLIIRRIRKILRIPEDYCFSSAPSDDAMGITSKENSIIPDTTITKSIMFMASLRYAF